MRIDLLEAIANNITPNPSPSIGQARMEMSFENLTNGQVVSVYEPTMKTSRIRSRKYINALRKYRNVRDLSARVAEGYEVVGFEDIPHENNDETKLVHMVNELVLLQKPNGKDVLKRLFVNKRAEHYKEAMYSTNHDFYKYLADDTGLVVIAVKYGLTDDKEEKRMYVKFTFTYIDRQTFSVISHHHELHLPVKEDFKFKLFLIKGVVCVLWTTHNLCSCWDFKCTDIDYREFEIQENLSDVCDIDVDGTYLSVTVKDDDFYDDVFAASNASKRLIAYYSLETGSRFDTKKAITEVLQDNMMDFASDILFLDIPRRPTWMVLEYLIPGMTLSHVHFYRVRDGHLERDTVLDFQELFSEYKIYFGRINKLQSSIKITRNPWQAHVWISKNHLMTIDLISYEIVAILKMDLSQFNDFKNELHTFRVVVEKENNLTVYVERYNEVLHFSHFQQILPAPSTFRQLSMQKSVSELNELNLATKLSAVTIDSLKNNTVVKVNC